MKDITNLIVVQESIAQSLGVEISGIFCQLNEDNDLSIHGTVLLHKMPGKNRSLQIKADLLDINGRVMYDLRDYSIGNLKSEFSSFSIFCASIDRFFAPNTMSSIRLYPAIYSKD